MYFEFYTPGNTWAHKLDAKIKLLFIVAAFIVLFIFDSPVVPSILLGLTVVAYLTSGLEFVKVRPFLLLASYISFASFIVWALFGAGTNGGRVLLSMGPISLRYNALLFAITVWARILTMLLAPVWLLMVTPLEKLTVALVGFRLPYSIAFVVTTAIRFIPTLIGVSMTIKDTQAARGVRFNDRNPIVRFQQYVGMLIPLAMRSMDIIENTSLAAETRGFTGFGKRTFYFASELAWTRVDILLTFLLVVVVIVCLFFRFAGYMG